MRRGQQVAKVVRKEEGVTYAVRSTIVGIDGELRILATKRLYLHREPKPIVQGCDSLIDPTRNPVDPATLVQRC